MHYFRFLIVVMYLLFGSISVAGSDIPDVAIMAQPPANTSVAERTTVGIFGGSLLLPVGVELDGSSVLKDQIHLSNLQGYRIGEPGRSHFTIRIGPLSATDMEAFEANAVHYDCYGFEQRVRELVSMDGIPLSMAIFFDEELFVSVISDDVGLWKEMLGEFAAGNGDPELQCLESNDD